LLILATMGMLLVIGCSSSSDTEPTATASPEPTATAESTKQTVDELLASIETAIEELRGIESPPPVEHMFVDQSGMQDRIAEEFADPETISQIKHESALLKLLGVIPQDADLTVIYEDMLGSQVLGLYDPEKEQFFVLGDDQSGADSIDTEAQLTYAHEYVHRLQDAKFDLEVIEELATGDDMSIAISALIEGDATSVQTGYMLKNFDFLELSELLEQVLAAQEEVPESPYFLQRSLEFPYDEGATFVGVLNQMGGSAAVDAVFIDLPRSTEQILHPEKYFDKEAPVELDIPDDAMGDGWSVQAENVLGEFFLRTWLEALGSDNADAAAAGWGGDSYAVFENDSGEFALGVFIVWDEDADALEFFDITAGALDSNENFNGSNIGLAHSFQSWNGPAGFVMLSRQVSEANGEVIFMAIASDLEAAASLIRATAGG
jgi:hypothetical protein